MASDITVLLNGFRRPQNIDLQLQALRNSTVQPDHIMTWYNNPGPDFKINQDAMNNTDCAINTQNWGVWARFFYAFNAPTKYVCVFDDDTVPGVRWLENCLNTMKTHRGLLGTIGLVYPPGTDDYYNRIRVGWDQRNPGLSQQVCEVDLVGHSWFFEKEWLQYFIRELPQFPRWSMCGEDMHFSYALRKYAGINTYTPPHPREDITLWGSTMGGSLGTDDVALFNQTQTTQRQDMNTFFKVLRMKGWKYVSERNQ